MKKLVWGILIFSFVCLFAFSSCDITQENSQTIESKSKEFTAVSESTSNLDEKNQTIPHEHSGAKTVKENEIKASCEKNGSYDEVIYCTGCNEELSRVTKAVQKTPHKFQNDKCLYCGEEKASEGLYFKSNRDGTCSLSGIGSCKDDNIIVPKTSPSGESVTSVAASAFYNRINITSIKLPDTVISIENDAFAYCANLESVVLSNNLNSLGAGAFSGCDSLRAKNSKGLSYIGSTQNPYLVLLEANDKTKTAYEIHSDTVIVANHAFSYCSSMTNIAFNDRVTSIGNCAFQGCSELISATLPKNLTKIEANMFSNCRKLETVNIPSGVKMIENHAFAFCVSLKNVTLPDTLTSIQVSAFYFCSSLTEMTIPNRVLEIQDGAFKDCSKLITVNLPSGITGLSNSIFSNCSSLKNITIPAGVEVINDYAFRNCTSLEQLVIPASVKTIEDNAFANCSGLKGVQFEVTNGWRCFDVNTLVVDSLDLSNEEKNAQYLYFRYNQYKWKRS